MAINSFRASAKSSANSGVSPRTGNTSSVNREGGSQSRNAQTSKPNTNDQKSESGSEEEEVVPRRWDKNGKPRRNLSRYDRSKTKESPFLDWICCRHRQESRSDLQKDGKELKKKKNKIPVKRVEYLWKIARRYDKTLRAQSRQQKKLDQMLRNNVIDDINDELDLEN